MCIQQTDLLIEHTRATLTLVAAMTEKEAQDKINLVAMFTQQSAQRHPFALVDSPAHLTTSLPEPRRPRQRRRLPFSASLLSRLAARGALPPRPSLLYTISEVDESQDLDTATVHQMSRSPSPFAADCGKSSRKRRTPEELDTLPHVYTQIRLAAHQMTAKSLRATLTRDAPAHWKRLRGMRCAV